MMTATAEVVKEDGVTPATPFDVGSGRIDLTHAGDAGLLVSDTAESFVALQGNLSLANTPAAERIRDRPGRRHGRRVDRQLHRAGVHLRGAELHPHRRHQQRVRGRRRRHRGRRLVHQPELPNPAAPNDVLAPFWTDLDLTSARGGASRVATLTDGVSTWLVVDWDKAPNYSA
jgi:hypothetical protein